MRADELVEVQAVKGHQDERAATGWRYAGESYLTTVGLARRRERAGLVEIEGEAPDEAPEEETEVQEGAPEGQEDDSAPDAETEQDEEEDSAGDEAPDELEDEEQEDG